MVQGQVDNSKERFNSAATIADLALFSIRTYDPADTAPETIQEQLLQKWHFETERCAVEPGVGATHVFRDGSAIFFPARGRSRQV